MTLFKADQGSHTHHPECKHWEENFPRYVIYRGHQNYTFGTHLLEHIGKGQYVSRASGELADIKILKESLESK